MSFVKMLWKALLICCVGCMCFFAGTGPARATDVWVSHMAAENVDVYVMDDTFAYGTSATGKWFSISVKRVQNGRLDQVMTWRFSQYKSDMWRYRTNPMSGNQTSIVRAPNKIFEYGMNRLGWSYSLNGTYYY